MKALKIFSLCSLLLVCAGSSGWANEAIDAAWYGADPDTYALRSRDTANDNSYSYTPSPEQWRDRNIYQLFTDRFASDGVDRLSNTDGGKRAGWTCDGRSYPQNRNFHHGGSWNGLKQQIPYLKGMGVTAVWISGVQENDQGTDTNYTPYHQYHAENFFRCDPAMGTFADLTSLIDELHANGIAVILDVAPNHMCDKNGVGSKEEDKRYWSNGGNFHWWNDNNKHCAPFDDLARFHGNGTINNWDTSPENLQGQFKGTDDLKQEDGTTSDILYKAFKNLIDATDCDGFRVDAIKHIPYDWCRNWAQSIRDHAAWRGKQNFLMFGELFSYDHGALSGWCKDGYGFNSALLFPLMQAMNNAFGNGYSSYQLGEEMSKISMYGAGKENAIAFLDNHDVNRFALSYGGGSAENARRIMAPAMTFLYMAPPVPLLFYGTEHMFNQGGHGNGTDRYAGNEDDGDWQRECMFDKGFQPGNASGDMFSDWAKSRGLYYHIAWLNGLRNKSRALRRGGFEQRYYSGGQGIYAFTKWYDNEVALVVVNTSDSTQSANIWSGKADTYRENGDGDIVSTDGHINVTLDGKGSKIYICNFVDNSADLGGGGGGGDGMWMSGTYGWPTESATTADTIYVNTEAGPKGRITEIELFYKLNPPTPDPEPWDSVRLEINTSWTSQGGDWWHAEIPANVITGTGTLHYFLCAREITETATNEYFDSRNGENYQLSISEPPADTNFFFQSVVSAPTEVQPGDTLNITAAIASGMDADITSLNCAIGYAINPTNGAAWPTYPMLKGSVYTNAMETSTNLWTYFTYVIPDLPAGATLKYYLVANNGDTNAMIYANNGGNDYVVQVAALPPVPAGLVISTPAGNIADAPSNTFHVIGSAGSDIVTDISWTNVNGETSGTITNAAAWSVDIPLVAGSNVVTFTAGSAQSTVVTNAADASENYNQGETYTSWVDTSLGSGFGTWVFSGDGDSGVDRWAWTDVRGFGLATSWGKAAKLQRPFPAALQAGDVLNVLFRNGNIAFATESVTPGIGIGVCTADNEDAGWRLYFNGGCSNYMSTTEGDGVATGIGWTTAGIQITLTMTGETTCDITLTPLDEQAPVTYTGLTLPAAPTHLRMWNWSSKEDIQGNNYDVLLDNPVLTRTTASEPEPVEATVTLVYGHALPEIPSVNFVPATNGAPASFTFQPEGGYDIETVAYCTNILNGEWAVCGNAVVRANEDGSRTIVFPDGIPSAVFKVFFTRSE